METPVTRCINVVWPDRTPGVGTFLAFRLAVMETIIVIIIRRHFHLILLSIIALTNNYRQVLSNMYTEEDSNH